MNVRRGNNGKISKTKLIKVYSCFIDVWFLTDRLLKKDNGFKLVLHYI